MTALASKYLTARRWLSSVLIALPRTHVSRGAPWPGCVDCIGDRLSSTRIRFFVSVILILWGSCFVSNSQAQTTFYWDANGGTAGTGGTGNWETATALWRNGSTAGALTVWSNTAPTDYAILEGTAGTVTVTGTIQVRRITFGVSGYTIASGAGTLTLVNDGIIDTAGFNATITEPIAGTVGLTKNNAGTLTLSGANSYTGATTINAGTITMGAANTFANGSTMTINGGTLDANSRTDTLGTVTLNSGSITGTAGGTLTIGALNLGGPVSTTATVSTGTSTLQLGGTLTYNAASNPNGATIAGRLSLGGANRTFTIGDSTAATDDLTISAVISQSSGSRALAKNGAGTLVLSGNNTYDGLTSVTAGTLTLSGNNTGATGGVTLTSGTLNLNNANAVGTGTLSLNGGTLNNNSGAAITLATNNAQSWGGNFTFTGTNDLDLGTGAVTLTGNRLLTTTAGNLTVGGIIGGAFTLEKAGGGTLILAGNSTYTGLTTVSGGVLKLGAPGTGTNTPLGTTGAGTTVASGAALDLNGYTLGTAEALTLSGTGISSAGALINTGAAATYSGAITLGAIAPAIGGSGNISLTGIVANGTTNSLNKVGTNTLILSNSNTFTGLTTVSSGTLQLGATGGGTNTPLGTTAAGTTVTSGASLDLNGFTLGTAEALTLSGTGISSAGALINNGAAATYSGAITLGAVAPSIGGSGNISLTGIVVDGATTILTKVGANTLTLSGTNTYSGGTTISAGTVAMGSASALGSGNTTLGASGTLDSAAFGFDLTKISGPGTLTGTGAYSYNSASSTSLSTVLAGTGATLTKSGNGTLTLSGNSTYTGGTTISVGIIEAQHNYALSNSGNIVITAGAQLSLNGLGAETFPAYVPGNPAAISSFAVGGGPDTVTINGAGPGGTSAAVINSYATVGGSFTQLNNNISLGSDATISSGSTSGNTLAIGRRSQYNENSGGLTRTVDTNSTIAVGANHLTFIGSAGTVTRVEGSITGSGNVTINTGGAVHYYAPEHSFTGTTTVVDGALRVDSTPNNAAPNDTGYNKFYGINGPLVIGDGSGSADSAIVYLGDGTASGTVPEGINPSVPITIFQDGLLSLKNNAQTIGQLTMTGGRIDSGSSGITYLDVANTNVTITPTASSGPSTIDGQLYLTHHLWSPSESSIKRDRTFDIGYDASNVATGDFVVNANVNVGSITKIGNGTMTLQTSNNDYDGTTTITNGILNVRVGTNGSDKSSLGLSGGGSTQDTTVSGTGTLQMQGGIAITKEGLTLSGNGFNGTQGALENLSGNNTWGAALTGQIVLAGNATIGSTGGLLTIPTTISSSGGPYGLTFRGSGNTTVTGAINTGTTSAATVTKMDAGTLTLSGTSDYRGATDIQGGIVVLTSNLALGNTVAGTSVSTGAELRLTNNITVGTEALTLNGTGNGASTGALRNFSGSNTYGGAVTINSSGTRINSDTGLLLLTGGISTGGNAFIVGGAGNTTESGTVGGSGALTKDGAGTAIFSNVTGIGGVTKNDAGTLTFSGASLSTSGGAVNMNLGVINFNGATATVGQVHLLGGASSTINVGGSSTLTTDEFDSAVGTTLAIASGGVVTANYNVGNTVFSGQITGSGGTFKALGTGQVTFDTTIINPNLHVWFGGTSVGTNASPLTVTITGLTTLQFSSLRITGDTILDFGNSSASVLNSASLTIDANVLITVQNWISLTDAWYATSTFAGGLLDRTGSTPENQITFTGFSNNQTTWATIATYGYFEHEIRPVPEPSTYGAIFISGAFGLIAYRRYRRRVASAASAAVAPSKAE
jgi:autotransporter-associated beta strand protein